MVHNIAADLDKVIELLLLLLLSLLLLLLQAADAPQPWPWRAAAFPGGAHRPGRHTQRGGGGSQDGAGVLATVCMFSKPNCI
jgi:hypothetical protein